MNSNVAQIQAAIAAVREDIIKHPVYADIKTLEDVQRFMEVHVFAVWDFMSLLKVLQRELTCVSLPWVPTGDAETRQLINEIVLGEESDVDQDGAIMSHFEMYLQAMKQAGANTEVIESFIANIRNGVSVYEALNLANVSDGARAFVRFTFDVIESNKPHVHAAVFTFGREDLIPGMFVSLVNDLNERFPNHISKFKYYLDRHIEVDGDHHSHLALRMTELLCGDDAAKWEEAKNAVVKALEMRNNLWNQVMQLSEA
ncbi:MAG: DUF3050 domain-containing protein [Flavobacteriales bacterium]|jgi:hypothetical protein